MHHPQRASMLLCCAGLRRTAQMMAQEIELSQGNLSLVSASANKLSVASNEYEKQHGKLRTSKGLLRQIRWHERKEDILLYSGLGFFGLCVAYVVCRRTLLFVPALPFEWVQSATVGAANGLWHGGSWLAGQAQRLRTEDDVVEVSTGEQVGDNLRQTGEQTVPPRNEL